MPYIDKYRQELIDEEINKLINKLKSANDVDYGAVEYLFFRVLHLLSQGDLRRFANMNALVGVLETTKAEFITRILQPYEALKLIDNWKQDGGPEVKPE